MKDLLKTVLCCSVCGKALSWDSVNRMTSESIAVLRLELKIEPCPTCLSRASKPAKLMKEAFELMKTGDK